MLFRYIRYFLLLSLIPAVTSYAEGDISEYDIEIIIFEDLWKSYANSEEWPRLESELPSIPHIPLTNSTSESNNHEPGIHPVMNVSDTEPVMLEEYAEKLEQSARYHILVHKSWRQAGLDAESAINIPIDSETNSPNNATPDLPVIDAAISTTGQDTRNTATSSIAGEIKVTLGRYLHIYTDLIYTQPNKEAPSMLTSSNNDSYKQFSIKSHRRMRSKELHFLDHPLVGILVKALPVEKTEENEPGEQAEL